MAKYFTPFDKTIIEAGKSLYERFADDEEERKKKEEEDKKKLVSELKSTSTARDPLALPNQPDSERAKLQSQRDVEFMGNDAGDIFILPDGKAASSSDNPNIQEKIKILNSPSRLMARQIEAERAGEPMPMGMEGIYPGKAEPIGTVERLLIGTSPLDQDQNVSTAERVGRKTLDIVGRTPRAILGGASRGIGGIAQLPQFINAYGVGSLEQAARYVGLYGEGTVDWDKLDIANTSAKILSEEAERFVKVTDDLFRVDELDPSAKTLMYITDFFMPVNVPGAISKSLNVASNVAEDTFRFVKGFPKREVDRDEILMADLRDAQTARTSPVEKQRQRELNEAYEAAKKDNPQLDFDSFEKYSDFGQKIMEKRAALYNQARKNINFEYGRRGIVEAAKERLRYPGGRSKSALAATYQIPPGGGAPELTKTLIFEKAPTYEMLENRKLYKQIMDAQAVVSAGAIAGAWDSYFQGTEYQDFSYIVGLTGIFANPTTTFKLLDNIVGGKLDLQNRIAIPASVTKRLPFLKDMDLFKSDPNITGEVIQRPLNLALLLHGIGKFVAEQKQGPEDVIAQTYANGAWNKRVTAMAAGVPIYKAFLANSVDKIEALGGMTELEAITRMSGSDFRNIESFAKEVMPYLPKEYLQSYTKLVRHGEKLVESINKSKYGDKTTEFTLTLEQIAQGVQMTALTGILKHVTSDPAFKNASKNVQGILLLFRTHHQEMQDQIGFIQDSLKALTGGDAKAELDFKELKDGANMLIDKMKADSALILEAAEGLSDAAGVVGNKSASILVRNLVDEPIEKGGMGLTAQRLSPEGRDAVSQKADKIFRDAFNRANDEDKAKFAKLEESLEGRVLVVNNYIDELYNLKNTELENFGDIASILKNKNRFTAFGTMSRKGPMEPALQYSNNIDIFIKQSKFNGLIRNNAETLKDKADALNERYPQDLRFTGNRDYTKFAENSDKTIDLTKTLNNIDEYVNASRKADGSSVTEQEYIANLLSQLDSNSPGFREEFIYVADASDMHRLRMSHSDWAWNNRFKNTGASKLVFKAMKRIDPLFSEAGIPELKIYNDNHTAFKSMWFEDLLGKKLLKSNLYRKQDDIGENDDILDPVDFVTDILKAENSKVAADLVKRIFGDYKDAQGITIVRGEERKQLVDIADDIFAYKVVHENFFGDRGSQKIKEKIDDLERNGLISSEMATKVRTFTEYTNKQSEYNLNKELENAESNIVRLTKSAINVKEGTDKETLAAELSRVDTMADVLEFLIPTSGTPTYARGEGITQPGVQVERIRELAQEKAELIQQSLGADPKFKRIAQERLQTIERQLDDLKQVPLEEITGSRFDVFVKQVIFKGEDIRSGENLTEKQRKLIKNLRDSLVSEMIRRSINKTSTRKAYLNPETDNVKRTYERATNYLNQYMVREGAFTVPSSAFELDSDFNIVELSTVYDNMKPQLEKLDSLLGDDPTFVKDLDDKMKALVAIKGEVPEALADTDFGNIPRGLTTPAALSRIYSGMRGVVSWRYLATEQIVREHQRAKHLMFHKILSDPQFLETLSLVLDSTTVSQKLADTFVKSFMPIMKSAGARAVVYDPVEGEGQYKANKNPTNKQIAEQVKKIWFVGGMLSGPVAAIAKTQTTPKKLPQGEIEVDIKLPTSLKDIAKSPVRIRRGPEPGQKELFRNMPELKSGPPKTIQERDAGREQLFNNMPTLK